MRIRSTDRRRGAAFLLLGGLLVAVAHVGGLGAPPVYDGLPVPADPYRYLDPPPGVHNPGLPLSAHVELQLVGGGMTAIDLPTGEYPPQAEVQLHHGDVNGNVPGVPSVTPARVTITAVPPPATPPPAGRQLHGNVYRFAVVAAGRALDLHPDSHAVVLLRQPRTSAADPRISVLVGDRWQLLTTHHGDGPGILVAALPHLGDVTILEETTGFVPSHKRSDIVAFVAFAVLAVAIVVLVRIKRLRGRR